MVGLGLKGRIDDGDESEAWRAAIGRMQRATRGGIKGEDDNAGVY